jgi:hypothetical protein
MRGQSAGLPTIMVLLLVFAGFGILLYVNAQPSEPLQFIVPTQVEPTSNVNAWQQVLSEGFGQNSTLFPTIAIPTQPFIAPTLPQDNASPTPFGASALVSEELFTLEPISLPATPTPPIAPSQGEANTPIPAQVAVQATTVWQPPALPAPLNRDPQGRDHYWFSRPVDSNAQNFGIPYYPYGSEGLLEINPSLIHHGIDMPNHIGETVRAAGSGTVFFASSEENPYFQNTSSYGNVVVIEHDFGWNGQTTWTLYAHLLRPVVVTGQHIEAGEPIGLIGNTGNASGPHVHFEVRVGENRYGSTYNPVLWMVPYVGHGTIAGLLVSERDNPLQDVPITLRNWRTGLIEATTATYILLDTVNDVNSDPNWNENFVFGDVPVGRYEVVASLDGQRISQIIDVEEGRTTFVDLKPRVAATALPLTPDAP